MNEPIRELARIESVDIGDVYNGMLGLCIAFAYEDGGGQSLGGYMLDAAMVVRVMRAIGVGSLASAKGRSVWVTHAHDSILKIEPLHKKDGQPFVLEEWKTWLKRHNVKTCWSDLCGDMDDSTYAAWLQRHQA